MTAAAALVSPVDEQEVDSLVAAATVLETPAPPDDAASLLESVHGIEEKHAAMEAALARGVRRANTELIQALVKSTQHSEASTDQPPSPPTEGFDDLVATSELLEAQMKVDGEASNSEPELDWFGYLSKHIHAELAFYGGLLDMASNETSSSQSTASQVALDSSGLRLDMASHVTSSRVREAELQAEQTKAEAEHLAKEQRSADLAATAAVYEKAVEMSAAAAQAEATATQQQPWSSMEEVRVLYAQTEQAELEQCARQHERAVEDADRAFMVLEHDELREKHAQLVQWKEESDAKLAQLKCNKDDLPEVLKHLHVGIRRGFFDDRVPLLAYLGDIARASMSGGNVQFSESTLDLSLMLYNIGHGAAIDHMSHNLLGPSLSHMRHLSQEQAKTFDIPTELNAEVLTQAIKWYRDKFGIELSKEDVSLVFDATALTPYVRLFPDDRPGGLLEYEKFTEPCRSGDQCAHLFAVDPVTGKKPETAKQVMVYALMVTSQLHLPCYVVAAHPHKVTLLVR